MQEGMEGGELETSSIDDIFNLSAKGSSIMGQAAKREREIETSL